MSWRYRDNEGRFATSLWILLEEREIMAGRGRRVTFHGAFASKAAAKRKERRVHGYIRTASIRGHRRYLVLKDKKR